MSSALLVTLWLGAVPADAPVVVALQAPAAARAEQEQSSAEPSPPVPAASALMVSQMEDYLDAERAESRLFVGMGVLAVGGGTAALAASDRDFLRGAGPPLIGVGLIQLVVGGSVWWRTERQKAELRSLILSDPARYVSEETARMKVVNDNFVIYRWTELSLLGAGVATAGVGRALDKEFVTGLGVGLAFQSAVMLTLDYFAEKRGREYADQVAGFRF